MFGPVRRMERRRGLVVGLAVGAAAARPRTVVYGAPTYYPCGATYYASPSVQIVATQPPPPSTQVIINEKYVPPPTPYVAPPPPVNQQLEPPPPYQQPAYNPSYPPPAEVVKKIDKEPRRLTERRYFLIINEANCQVLQVDNGTAYKGAKLVIDKRRLDRVSIQRWYFDDKGVIRCALNDYALEAKGDRVYTAPYSGEPFQLWVFEGNRIVNKRLGTECIGLKKRLFLSDDADVIISHYDNKPYQHWRVEYLAV